MNSSISRQLVFWLAVPLMLLALCSVLIHYFNDVAPDVISTDLRLKESAAALAARVRVRDGKLSADVADLGIAERFAVRDGAQHLLAGDAKLPVPSAAGAANPEFVSLRIDRRRVRTMTSRIETPQGPVTITVADGLKYNGPAQRFGFMSTLLWDFVQLDLTLVLVWVGIRLGLRPLGRLRDEIAARSPHDLRPIHEASVPREMAPLAATLNRLLSMLGKSVQSQQQFIANTAHQLRTPITGMLAQLDLLAADPAAAPVLGRVTLLQEGARQLAHSANQLLTLARANPALNATAKQQPVELSAIASEVTAKFVDRALAANLDLGADLQPASVLADPSLLDDLLGNLVDNALKYTPAGGRVTVRAGRHDGRPYLAVEDNGPGIPENERQLVRKRFYRVQNSPGHGSGLGLAIVEEIARLCNAVVHIESGAEGVGTRVSVLFPEATAEA
jgi:two-component system sensor histidine kinase TctE